MRPKKVILLVDDNEQELSVLKFMLEINGFRVFSAHAAADAVSLFCAVPFDLVLADFYMPGMNGDQLVARLKKIGPHIPMVLLGDPSAEGGPHVADALLDKRNCSVEQLLERIKVMTARKRGPRKKPPETGAALLTQPCARMAG